MKQPELIITDDGSHSLYVEELDECYHSTHGAVQESEHVFLKHGLDLVVDRVEKPSILEIGFGTGLNCLLTFTSGVKVKYTSIEKYPLTQDVVSRLNYTSIPKDSELLAEMHRAKWDEPVNLSGNELLKIQGDMKFFDFGVNKYDIVYFDAFSPESQPDLWTAEIFRKMHKALKDEGILVTYCAKGIVKRTLKSVGFLIENPPGPPGKREMTRAIK